MVLWQIHTLDHLDTSGFGRPFPRHGLQLLFWFSNHCVTFEPDNSGDVMKLVSGCQPENGAYGFHRFGNMEELLPVLHKPKKNKSSRQLLYFVVGNLSTQSYPQSADLPAFVRENLGADGVSNSDRIIISYQVKTRLVGKVYVTEHDDADVGGFRSDGTHEVSSQLIRLLQNPQLDLSSLLTQMGYYDDVEMLQDAQDPSVQMMLSMMQNDPTGFFSQAFSRQLDLDRFCSSTNPDGSGSLMCYTTLQKKKKKKKKSSKKLKRLRELSWRSSWSDPYRDYYEDCWIRSSYGSGGSYGKGGGGGFSWFLKLVLKAGALYLAARCLFWLVRNIWRSNWIDKLLQRIPGWISLYPSFPRFLSFPRTHIMLDYVY
ncbi:uncharacterized protein LOC122828946 isoform X1 [Gambusia affinis]|uniref:uncharacterized protein LOC122828946 isoform X1 n=1 Tax=Gambusia affinis TaxID=33528 RepID=UPI000F30534C|nr:uncharacterized protein LOC122828946 isoform X1 [Gambusia affinis]XP_043968980.1 uncharacterized protein LOC122828946 isoform X1 [Gambusia affinis]